MEYSLNPHITSGKLKADARRRLIKIRDSRFIEPYDKTHIRSLLSHKRLQRPDLEMVGYILEKYKNVK